MNVRPWLLGAPCLFVACGGEPNHGTPGTSSGGTGSAGSVSPVGGAGPLASGGSSAVGGSSHSGGGSSGGNEATGGSSVGGGVSGANGGSAGGAGPTGGNVGSTGGDLNNEAPTDPCAVKTVDAGNVHTCALGYSGNVWCWGNNSYAAVGEGAATGAQRTPYRLAKLGTDNTEVITGQDTSCVKKADGRLLCWGSFGDGNGWDHVRSATPFDVFGTDWKQLALHTAACVVTADDGIACWGFGDEQSHRIEGFGNDVTQVSISHDTVCAVKKGGSVMCGRLGGAAPVLVAGITDATQVSTGGALESDSDPWGRLVATGRDGSAYWALGGQAAQRLTEVGSDVREIYVGETTASEHLFVAGKATGIATWGTNRCGALGDGLGGNGDTSHDHRNIMGAPAPVTGIDAYLRMGVGHEHACAILPDHKLWCWGRNAEGQIGSGATDTVCDSGTASPNQPTPVEVELCP